MKLCVLIEREREFSMNGSSQVKITIYYYLLALNNWLEIVEEKEKLTTFTILQLNNISVKKKCCNKIYNIDLFVQNKSKAIFAKAGAVIQIYNDFSVVLILLLDSIAKVFFF